MTLSPGDRIIVTMPRSAPREGEYVEDRGSRARVLLDGDTKTCVVLRERVRAVVSPKRLRSMGGPPVTWVSRPVASGVMLPDATLVDVPAHMEVTGIDHEARTISVALKAVPKPPKPLRDAAYLAWVREHRCCACQRSRPDVVIEAHHFGPRGMSQKTDDQRAVPLCTRCHREFHDKGVVRDLSREGTERLFVGTQRELLMHHFVCADLLSGAAERDAVIVEALINHLRESA